MHRKLSFFSANNENEVRIFIFIFFFLLGLGSQKVKISLGSMATLGFGLVTWQNISR